MAHKDVTSSRVDIGPFMPLQTVRKNKQYECTTAAED